MVSNEVAHFSTLSRWVAWAVTDSPHLHAPSSDLVWLELSYSIVVSGQLDILPGF